jgi:hypothetical protein
MSDVPTPLIFVDPAATDPTYRVCLWAAPGEGKSVAASSAPDPILVLSADRPSAYLYARKHHAGKDIREVRYAGVDTLTQVYTYLAEPGCDIRTVIVDPVSNIVDQLADVAPAGREGGPDYQWINKKMLGFVKSLRRFDVNVVLVAHEKVNDGKKGDGKMYPSLGGATLINKLLAEMDIVAHIERVTRTLSDESEETVWVGQLQPVRNLVCKESTAADLGDRRVADLSRWFALANEATRPDNSDLPLGLADDEPDPAADPDIEEQIALGEAE